MEESNWRRNGLSRFLLADDDFPGSTLAMNDRTGVGIHKKAHFIERNMQ